MIYKNIKRWNRCISTFHKTFSIRLEDTTGKLLVAYSFMSLIKSKNWHDISIVVKICYSNCITKLIITFLKNLRSKGTKLIVGMLSTLYQGLMMMLRMCWLLMYYTLTKLYLINLYYEIHNMNNWNLPFQGVCNLNKLNLIH